MRARSIALLAAASIVVSSNVRAQSTAVQMRLYPGQAPGSEHWQLPEEAHETPNGTTFSNVRNPELTAYLPETEIANGAAAIILPGGGLRVIGIGPDTSELVAMLNDHGIAAFVLKYRTLQIEQGASQPGSGGGPIAWPKLDIRNGNANPSPDDPALAEVLRLAVEDAQTALRIVRAHASEWHVDPHRVGMIGTSAGGGVAIGTVLAQVTGATPDFVGSVYGPSLQDVVVPVDAPPLFIATEADHGPVTDGLLALFGLWKEAGKRTELHVYDVPTFAIPPSLYGERMIEWLSENELLASPAE